MGIDASSATGTGSTLTNSSASRFTSCTAYEPRICVCWGKYPTSISVFLKGIDKMAMVPEEKPLLATVSPSAPTTGPTVAVTTDWPTLEAVATPLEPTLTELVVPETEDALQVTLELMSIEPPSL